MNKNILNNYTFIIAVRKGSQRVKNKNTRKFGDSNLVAIKLKQIRRLSKKANILLSSDCPKSLSLGKKYGAEIDDRERKFCSNSIPMPQVYKYLAKKIKTKFVCYLHVTSPFLKDATLKKALKTFISKKNKFSSVVTVTSVKEYLWKNDKAINYNPKRHPRSQDLKGVIALNFAINIVEKKFMEKQGRITSDNFFPIEINFPENMDIDTKWQFRLGNFLKKTKNYD
tara:strand:- start:22711 stop:23388 length:678 start_codon:yes stop_codon:yes gene_type:complete